MKLGSYELQLPIIQGGMGIGVSLGGLAGAVASCGGMGVISSACTGYDRPDYIRDPNGANLIALKEQIRKAKEIAKGKGMVAVNVMVASRQYADSVRTAIAAGADAIISGAGLPTMLPALAAGSKALLAPIVSSARAARTICRLWDKHASTAPDFVVVEGCEAGGHLGFSRQELDAGTAQPLEEIVTQVLEEVKPFAEKYARPIPVFAAGGVYTGADMARMMRLGAAGVQIATRFIATEECDASPVYKQQMIEAKKEDIVIVQSPVGMPGRALRTPLIRRLEQGERIAPTHCYGCLTPCSPDKAPYCITKALAAAVKGDVENGLFFCGSNVWRLDKIVPVRELMDELMREWRNAQ